MKCIDKHDLRWPAAILLVAVVGVLFFFIAGGRDSRKDLEHGVESATAAVPTAIGADPALRRTGPDSVPAARPLVGEEIMARYLAEDGSVEEDLILVKRLLISYDTLVKAEDALPLGANGDIADALRGENPFNMPFLPPGHKAFNKAGEVVDRWATPIFFHALSATLIEVRSAGPDQAMWTADDVHLNTDGSFADHGELLPVSLSSSRTPEASTQHDSR